MATPDPKKAEAEVLELFPTAALPSRINPKGIKDAVEGLRDSLRGSIREGGSVAELQRLLERLLWNIAKDEDSTNATLALAVALDELDELLSQPATAAEATGTSAADAQRIEALEGEAATSRMAVAAVRDELRAVQRSLDGANATIAQERDEHAGELAAATLRVEGLTHDLASERTARETAERVRNDEFQRALATLREEHTSAAHAITSLTELAAKAGAAHAAIGDVLAAAVNTAQTSGSPNLAGQHATLAARLRALDAWVHHVDERQQSVTEELSMIPEEDQRLRAVLRTSGWTQETHTELAVLTARTRQLEDHSNTLIALKKPVEAERGRIRELIRAIELAAQPAPEKITLPEIPAYPVPLTPEEAIIASDDGAPDGEPMADGNAGPDGDASPTSPLPVHIAIVLYELVRQRVGAERRAVLWITKSAEEAGILTRYELPYWSFTKPVLSEEHKVLIAQFLTFGGR
ncbi:MAG: hypothetical protein Q7S02_02520, partial [bacterium]|nr:hypothetical protein [bacterium]